MTDQHRDAEHQFSALTGGFDHANKNIFVRRDSNADVSPLSSEEPKGLAMARKSKLDRPLLGPGPLIVQKQLPGHDGWQMVGVILQGHGISIEFEKEAAGWEAMAQDGLRKLEAFAAASTGTSHDQFNIEHTQLYVDVCRRFAREPDLVDLKAWQAVAEQFVIDGGKLAERYGVQL